MSVTAEHTPTQKADHAGGQHGRAWVSPHDFSDIGDHVLWFMCPDVIGGCGQLFGGTMRHVLYRLSTGKAVRLLVDRGSRTLKAAGCRGSRFIDLVGCSSAQVPGNCIRFHDSSPLLARLHRTM